MLVYLLFNLFELFHIKSSIEFCIFPAYILFITSWPRWSSLPQMITPSFQSRKSLITGTSSTVYMIRIGSIEWTVSSVDRST